MSSQPALTIKQVATRLSASKDAVRSLILRKQLKAFVISMPGGKRKTYRIEPEWLDEFIQTSAPVVKTLEKPPKPVGLLSGKRYVSRSSLMK